MPNEKMTLKPSRKGLLQCYNIKQEEIQLNKRKGPSANSKKTRTCFNKR